MPLLPPQINIALFSPHMVFTQNLGLTPNGYCLTPAVFNDLISANVRSFQVTLDGFAENHNRTRFLANGNGTWDIIVSNLLSVKKVDGDFHVQVRTNYTDEVFHEFGRFLDFLVEKFGDDPRFGFYCEAAKDYGTLNKGEDFSVIADEASKTRAIAKLIKEKGLKGAMFDTSRYSAPFSLTCYAANPNSIILDYDGTIRKCTFDLDDDSHNKIGVQQDTAWEIKPGLLAKWTVSASDKMQENAEEKM